METTKRLFCVSFILTMVFCFSQTAFALVGSQAGAGGEGGITVYPNAPGTKYEGPLTIYYLPATSGDTTKKNMHFFMRLRKGSTLYQFSGIAENVVYTDANEQQARIEMFIEDTVIPFLYPGVDPAPLALLKSIDQKVEDDPLSIPPCCGDMLFAIMDIVIAVQD